MCTAYGIETATASSEEGVASLQLSVRYRVVPHIFIFGVGHYISRDTELKNLRLKYFCKIEFSVLPPGTCFRMPRDVPPTAQSLQITRFYRVLLPFTRTMCF